MKRMKMWLSELTLIQQLLTIIFLFVTIFAGFVFVFLTPAIDRFSETEMFRILHNSQESLIRYFDENPNSTPQPNISYSETFVIDVLYDPDADDFVNISGGTIMKELKDEIKRKAELNTSGTQDYTATVYLRGDDGTMMPSTYLYAMTKLRDGRSLISAMPETYRGQFRTSLARSVIAVNIIFVSILFVLLIVWVGSMLIPLSQITDYIQKLKNDDKDAVLNVKRNDEIGEVAKALQDMEAELAKQNREKEEMIQNISHDLKTPIATIKSYGESIKDGIYPYETLEKSVDVIIEHADRLEKKVHSLIILNKMGYLLDNCEEGETLDMNSVIDKVLLSLRVIRPEIEFQRDTQEGVMFHGEEEPWRIVVENLIDNALRYAKSYIRIVLRDQELSVINDGVHIDPEKAESLFRPYEKGSGGQFGLGLSIVNRVTTTYGYHVQAENLPEGVCFRIWRDVPKKEKQRREKTMRPKKNSAARA